MNKQSSITIPKRVVIGVVILFVVMMGGLGYLTYSQYQMNAKLNDTYSLINDAVDTRVTGGVATGNDIQSVNDKIDSLSADVNQIWSRVEQYNQ